MGVMGLADGTDLAREGKEGYLPGVCGSRWEDRELSPGRWLQNAAGLGGPQGSQGEVEWGVSLWAGGKVGRRLDMWVWALGSLPARFQHGWEALSGTPIIHSLGGALCVGGAPAGFAICAGSV